MLRKALAGFAAIALGGFYAVSAQAQDVKLYAFSSGALTIGKGILQNLAAIEPPIKIPVGFYVIKHPKGNVIFDTGNNDRIIKDPSYWGANFKALKPVNTPDVAIDAQLAKDRSQAGRHQVCCREPPSSRSWRQRRQVPELDVVVQKDEIRNAFWPEAGTGGPYMIGDVCRSGLPTRDYPNAGKMLQLDGRPGPVWRRHHDRQALGRSYAR